VEDAIPLTGMQAPGIAHYQALMEPLVSQELPVRDVIKPAGNGHQVVVNYSGDLCLECHTGNRHGTDWENSKHAPPPYTVGSNCVSAIRRLINIKTRM